MKKLLTIATASLAMAAVAASYSPTIGVTTLTTSKKNTIIPVKYTSLASTGEAVSAAALVSTKELPAGTQMYVFDGSTYKAWVLSAEGEEWTAVSSESTSGGYTVGVPAGTETLAAGSAIWLVFANQPTDQTVVIYGDTPATLSASITAGTTEKPKAHLLVNPTEEASVSIADKLIGVTPANGDTIQPITDTFDGNYIYNGNVWKKVSVDVDNGGAVTITEGLPTINQYQGFWYISKGGSGTITW